MFESKKPKAKKSAYFSISLDYWLLMLGSFIALTLTFWLSSLDFGFPVKLMSFLIVTVAYASFAAVCYAHRRKRVAEFEAIPETFKSLEENAPTDEDPAKFQALESLRATFDKNTPGFSPETMENLPNERDFTLILENQVAESQRSRGERHLSVLSIGIIDFDKLTEKYGEAAGEKASYFVATQIREELRNMDFLSRAKNDEFLSVLPTLDQKSVGLVVNRIQKAIEGQNFLISDQKSIRLSLSFGSATLTEESETAQELLRIARFKRDEARFSVKGAILQFPKEYLN